MNKAEYLAARKNRAASFSVYTSEKIEEVRRLYLEGKSTRQVASLSGVSKSYVNKLCKDFSRSRSVALQLRFPPKSKHWRSSRNAARKQVERKLGRKLDTSEHVHHINGDFTDNRDANLEVVDGVEHNRQHTLQRIANGWTRRKTSSQDSL